MTRRALVLGATGLVGRNCVAALQADPAYEAVTVLSRKPLAFTDKHVHVEVMDLAEMDERGGLFAVDDIFCCLGSTRARAGSREAFRHVDHDLCVEAARLGAEQRARNFVMVSALNAHARSPLFYFRTKGQAETDAAATGMPVCHFFRPSFLLGHRDETRTLEWLGIQTMRTVRPGLHLARSRFTPVAADRLARSMVNVARADRLPGQYRYEYADVLEWSGVSS